MTPHPQHGVLLGRLGPDADDPTAPDACHDAPSLEDFTIDEATLEDLGIVDKMFEWAAAGHSWEAVRDELASLLAHAAAGEPDEATTRPTRA